MVGKVQMDVTEDDERYFAERGFTRDSSDLNCFRLEAQAASTRSVKLIVGRSWGWVAYRTTLDLLTNKRAVHWASDFKARDPITCYAHAEITGWRNG